MAKLSKASVQRLAVLRALSLWRQKGAYGPVRLQKTLFFADMNNTKKIRIFTFKKYYLGQYSDEVSESFNALREAGHLHCIFDGPAERLKADIGPATKAKLKQLFSRAFPQWEKALMASFQEWGYLTTDRLLKKAHDDPSYTESKHDEVIFTSSLRDVVDIPELEEETAENLTDMVDPQLTKAIRDRLLRAVKVPVESVDWRKRYFGERHGHNRYEVG